VDGRVKGRVSYLCRLLPTRSPTVPARQVIR
jgi:hypothetical protein